MEVENKLSEVFGQPVRLYGYGDDYYTSVFIHNGYVFTVSWNLNTKDVRIRVYGCDGILERYIKERGEDSSCSSVHFIVDGVSYSPFFVFWIEQENYSGITADFGYDTSEFSQDGKDLICRLLYRFGVAVNEIESVFKVNLSAHQKIEWSKL